MCTFFCAPVALSDNINHMTSSGSPLIGLYLGLLNLQEKPALQVRKSETVLRLGGLEAVTILQNRDFFQLEQLCDLRFVHLVCTSVQLNIYCVDYAEKLE